MRGAIRTAFHRPLPELGAVRVSRLFISAETSAVEPPFWYCTEEMEAGERFGEYRLVRRLGRGGQGEVYEAKCGLGLTWALKVGHSAFTDDPKALRRVAEEAVWVNEMFHKIPRNCGILAGEHYGVLDQRFYVKMRLLRGESLADRIRTNGRLPLEEALSIACSVASAVALAHQHQALHHDLKPANIFLEADGTVQVLDWGCVRLIEAGRISGATTGGPTCTVGYAPLEQYEPSREATATAADVYSLGVVLFEMLTGANPFLGEGHQKRTRTQEALAAESGTEAARRPQEVFTARIDGLGVTVRMAPLASVSGAAEGFEDALTGRTWSLSQISDARDPGAATDEANSELFPARGGMGPMNSITAILRSQALFDVRQSDLVIGLPAPLVELLSRMLTPDARLRLTDMTVVVAELNRLMDLRDRASLDTWGGPQKRQAKPRVWAAVALVSVPALAAVGYYVFGSTGPKEAAAPIATAALAELPAMALSRDADPQTSVVTTSSAPMAPSPASVPPTSTEHPSESMRIQRKVVREAERPRPAASTPVRKRDPSTNKPKVLFEADERR